MVDSKLEDKICEFVKNGGTAVATYMLGTVNENDLCHLGGLPCGKLKDVFGIWNEEIDTLYPDEANEVCFCEKHFAAVDYCELIHLQGAEALGEYKKDFYQGYPAVTRNRYGEGNAYYLAFRDKGDFADKIVGDILGECHITSDFDGALPFGVSAHSRTDGKNVYLFLENYSQTDATLNTEKVWTNVETEEQLTGEITLGSISVLILKREI
jgi:beta-galactosidase